MDSLVSTDWLAAELGADDLRILDATTFLPGSGRDARAEYEAAHIPGAAYFDIEAVSDPDSPLPHIAGRPPSSSPAGCAPSASTITIGSSSTTTARSTRAPAPGGCCAASAPACRDPRRRPRRNGWRRGGRSQAARHHPRPGHFAANPARAGPARQGGHARPRGRGQPRHRRRPPGRSLPRRRRRAARPASPPAISPAPAACRRAISSTPTTACKQGGELRAVFDEAGVDLARPLVATCGSGVTACVILFGAHLLGKDDLASL